MGAFQYWLILALSWFRSYLSDRHSICSCTKSSSLTRISYGVPHGSVLAPLLLSSYLLPFGSCVRVCVCVCVCTFSCMCSCVCTHVLYSVMCFFFSFDIRSFFFSSALVCIRNFHTLFFVFTHSVKWSRHFILNYTHEIQSCLCVGHFATST